MNSQSIDSQAKANRYLVVLESNKKKDIEKAEIEMKVSLVSSSDLSDKNRAFQVMSKEQGIFFKNVNIAVVDQVPTKALNAAMKNSKSPIVYWEEEREYRAIDAIQKKLNEIEETMQLLQRQVDELKRSMTDNKPTWSAATWGVNAIGLEESSPSGKGVAVCILDTGLYKAHPDFDGRNIEGKSFIEGEQWDKDGNGHGTHCAGTAVGNSTSDGKRYGVAHEADIFIGKVLSDSGSGSTSGIIDAIDWAIEKQCKVISMSLGSPVSIGENPSLIFEQAGKKALEQGCLIIAAAGNDSRRPNYVRPVSSPANCRSIMSVAALDEASNVAYFSNGGLNAGTGGKVDVAAPGVDVYSSFSKLANANEELYKRLNGTSMATPHVAGIAALYWEQFPDLSASEIWLKIEQHAKPLPHLSSVDVGQGLVQTN